MISRLITTIVLAAVLPQASQGAVVSLRHEASVRGVKVTLDEIADIECPLELKEELGGLVLAYSPRPDLSLVVSRQRVQKALSAAGLEDKVRLTGADSVKVTTQSMVVGQEALLKAAADMIRGELEGVFGEVVVTPRGKALVHKLPAGELELKPVMPGVGLAGKILVPIEVMIDGEKYIMLHVNLDVRLYHPVLVALVRMNRGKTITEGDVALERREVTQLKGRYFKDVDGAVGKNVRGIIRIGEIIKPSSVEVPIAVRRKQRITMVYRSGFVRVTLKGEALQDGRPGQVIKVRNVSSGAVMSARVIDGKTVEVIR